jgi:hypothetical protein
LLFENARELAGLSGTNRIRARTSSQPLRLRRLPLLRSRSIM